MSVFPEKRRFTYIKKKKNEATIEEPPNDESDSKKKKNEAKSEEPPNDEADSKRKKNNPKSKEPPKDESDSKRKKNKAKSEEPSNDESDSKKKKNEAKSEEPPNDEADSKRKKNNPKSKEPPKDESDSKSTKNKAKSEEPSNDESDSKRKKNRAKSKEPPNDESDSKSKKNKAKSSTNVESDSKKENNERNDSGDSKDAEEIKPSLVVDDKMPTFFHIGGLAKDCLNTGYKFGVWHFDCTTDLGEKLTLYSYGTGKPNYLDVHGGVGVREELGRFHFSQSWSTDGLMGKMGMESNVFGGLANTILQGLLAPHQSDGVQLLLHTAFERKPINLNVIIPILKEPKLMGYFLLKPSTSYLVAYRAVYDFDVMGFDMHALCLGYDNGRTELGLKLENFKDLRGSIFQRLGERCAVALKMNIYGSLDLKFAVGGQYQLTENAMLKANFRDDGYLGMVYRQYLDENIAIMYHLDIGLGGSQRGDHRFGISWSLKG